jgi:hypothetical protein
MSGAAMKNIRTSTAKKKIESGLSGVAGEYFVAGELSRQGYLATLTQRNTRGVDILVSNADATSLATIQVKTNQGYQHYWLLTKKAESFHAPRLFYVMVNIGTPSGMPEYHVVPSKIVSTDITESHAEWLKTPGRNGQAHVDNNIRKFNMPYEKYLNKWELLGLD